MHLQFTDHTARETIIDRYGARTMQMISHHGADLFAVMESFGGPFKLNQIIVKPPLKRQHLTALVRYINESRMLPIYIRQSQRDKLWRIIQCDPAQKLFYQLDDEKHRTQSAMREYRSWAAPVYATIELIDGPAAPVEQSTTSQSVELDFTESVTIRDLQSDS